MDADRLVFCGTDLLDEPTAPGAGHDKLLGTSLSVVFQDPMTSFNPTMRIGSQLAEVARYHQGLDRKGALARAVDRLDAVRVRDPERRARQYPFEFSGGMRQRAMIGMGLMGTPRLIIADEPTTALDVTVQAQVLALLKQVQREQDAALLFISHDVSVVREVCDRVVVMYAGRIVEELPVADLVDPERTDSGGAQHPYTRALLAAVPDMTTDLDRAARHHPGAARRPGRPASGVCVRRPLPARLGAVPHRGAAARHRRARPVRRLLAPRGAARRCSRRGEVVATLMSTLDFDSVTVRYGHHTVLDRVSLSVPDGQVVGLVGESGSGKSTLARTAVGLAPLTGGAVLLDGSRSR